MLRSIRLSESLRYSCVVCAGLLVAGCSSSFGNGGASDSARYQTQPSRAGAVRPQTDNDYYPPYRPVPDGQSAPVTYRGGRDPVTQRAPAWPVSTPAMVESAPLRPLPPPNYTAPAQQQAYQPVQPPYQPQQRQAAAPGYPQPQSYPPAQSYAPAPSLPRAGAPAYDNSLSHLEADIGQTSAQTPQAGAVVVKEGDTLYRIAQQNRVSLASLMRVNNMTNPTIWPGQRLVLPPR